MYTIYSCDMVVIVKLVKLAGYRINKMPLWLTLRRTGQESRTFFHSGWHFMMALAPIEVGPDEMLLVLYVCFWFCILLYISNIYILFIFVLYINFLLTCLLFLELFLLLPPFAVFLIRIIVLPVYTGVLMWLKYVILVNHCLLK